MRESNIDRCVVSAPQSRGVMTEIPRMTGGCLETSVLPSPFASDSAARVKTPTGWCDSSSPKEATWLIRPYNGLRKSNIS
jgi:hypothetical protein